jgi:hypothetical protein
MRDESPRAPGTSNDLEGDALVLHRFDTLVVARPRLVAAAQRPGRSEMISYRVFAQVGSRPVELLVRISDGDKASYACWSVQRRTDTQFTMLNTFGAVQA